MLCSDSVVNLKFEEEPNYAKYISWFEPIVNLPERPLQIDNSLQAIVSVHTCCTRSVFFAHG